MASEGKSAGGSSGGRGGAGGGPGGLSLGLSLEIPEEVVTKMAWEDVVESLGGEGKDDGEGGVVLVDCRNADYTGGHIPGSDNVPFDAETQEDSVARLVEKYANSGARAIVFACLYGEQRSPALATAYAYKQSEALGEGAHGPQVRVLLGGFARYLRDRWEDRHNPEVVASFDESCWVPEDGVEGRFVHKSEVAGGI